MSDRIKNYKLYKKVKGTTGFEGVKFPKGNKEFWKNAYNSALGHNFGEKLNKVINKNKKEVKITFNKQEQKEERLNNLLDVLEEKLNEIKDGVILVKTIDGQHFTVNRELINKLRDNKLKDIIVNKVSGHNVSDAVIADAIVEQKKLWFSFINKDDGVVGKKKYGFREGAFFKYLVNDDIYLDDWERYGLFKDVDPEKLKQNCMYHALRNHTKEDGTRLLTNAELCSVAYCFRNTNIPIKDLKEICKKLNIYVKIFDVANSKYAHINKPKNEEEKERRTFDIGLMDKHYFIMDKKTNCTKYYIDHFDDIKDLDRPNDITRYKNDMRNNKPYYERTKPEKRRITSSALVQYLLRNKDKYLTKISRETINIHYTPYYSKLDEDINLEYSNLDVKPVEYVPRNKDDREIVAVYFDTETKLVKGYHEAYMICAKDLRGNYYFEGDNCVSSFLNTICKKYDGKKHNVYLIAHNLGFDFRMLLKHEACKITNIIERGNTIISASVILFGKDTRLEVSFKDSYAFITTKLLKFPNIFNIDNIQKEAICFDWYNNKTIKTGEDGKLLEFKMTIEEAIIKATKSRQFINDDELEDFKKSFKDTINKWDLKKDSIDMIEYAKRYCKMDVIVLMKGFEKFREWMKTITGLDIITEVCTLASLADRYVTREGIYDGCYALANKPREFTQASVVGGRTMSNKNEKYHVKLKMQDFDGVALYPSAMNRMNGCLKGLPKVIQEDQLNEDFLLKQDGFTVEVKIISVGKCREFPLLSIINDKTGTRDYVNAIEGQIYKLSKTSYEDAKEFQNIEMEIIRGYYYDEGFNTKINEVSKYLFEERIKKKKENNPIQEAYKLLMNAIYGKTIEKEHNTEKHFFNSIEERNDYIIRHHNHIESCSEIANGKWVIKTNCPTKIHYSRPHIGSEILATSKRIMNEVMCLAEDNGIRIYYQDTDSMHIEDEHIGKLSDLFIKKYNRELIGKKMGQFHCDFSFDCDPDYEPYAVETIILGKKCYLDIVRVLKDGKESFEPHIRLKGIPQRAIKNHEKYNIMEIYEKLFKKEEIIFDLKKSGCIMEFKRDYKINERLEFKRYITFDEDKRDARKARKVKEKRIKKNQ